MSWLFVLLLIINLISFLMFAFRKPLDNCWISGIHGASDELALIMALGGAIGAFIAMRINPDNGIDDDIVFKITIPVGIVIQIATVTYITLFELGIVK